MCVASQVFPLNPLGCGLLKKSAVLANSCGLSGPSSGFWR